VVCDNLLFGNSQGLPSVSVYGGVEAAGEQEEQTSLRAGGRVVAVGRDAS